MIHGGSLLSSTAKLHPRPTIAYRGEIGVNVSKGILSALGREGSIFIIWCSSSECILGFLKVTITAIDRLSN